MALYAQEIIKEKIERNQELICQMPEHMIPKFINNTTWAEELSGRLEQIDVANGQRDKVIQNIYDVLDDDYQEMDKYLNPEKYTNPNLTTKGPQK